MSLSTANAQTEFNLSRAPRFVVLASGSAANATVVVGERSILLVDCGLSARELSRRLAAVGLDKMPFAGIVVTHEHTDHIKGLNTLVGNVHCEVGMTNGTYAELARGGFSKMRGKPRLLESGADYTVGEFTVRPFTILHDAAEPVGFVVTDGNGARIGIATDLGKVTHVVREALRGVEALIVEANHDLERLMECSYPWHVKQRIASSYGHLSNSDAAKLVGELAHDGLECVVLGHLSQQSNEPGLAYAAVAAGLQSAGFTPKLVAASQGEPFENLG